jgi:HK97 family phage major capsid protein
MLSAAIRKRLRPFGEGGEAKHRAAQFGAWTKAVLGNEAAARRCKEWGVPIERAGNEGVNSAGGAAVPDDFRAAIVAVRETAGVFRQHAAVIPMSRDVLDWPRRTGGLTVNFIGEGAAITTLQMSFDLLNLVAKKVAGLTIFSSELDEDSAIGEILATEFGYQFALKEDSCGFNGDGTSAYGGIRGITTLAIDGNHNASKITAAVAHNSYTTLDLVDLTNLMGGVIAAALPNAAWYVSQLGFATTLCRLSNAVVEGDTTTGAPNRPSFLGFPVVPAPSLPRVTTNLTGQVMMIFGDLAMASAIGDRRGANVRILRERFADSDQIGIVGTERFDINIHDLGDNSSKGPLAALVAP